MHSDRRAFPATSQVLAALAVATASAVACDGGSDDSQARRVGPGEYGMRDSAGAVVVENAKPADGSRLGWTVSSAPVVSVGTQEGVGEWQLHRAGDATKLSDGRIVVANSGSHELLIFDEAGEHVGAWGGQGDGPGEFARLDRVAAWRGDSIIASDGAYLRVSIFDASGAHGRTTTIPGAVGGLLRRAMGAATGQAPGHTLLEPVSDSLLLTWDPPVGMSGFQQQDHVFEVKSPDGSLLASLGEYPGPQTYTATVDHNNILVFLPLAHPFGHTTEWTVWGDLVAFGRTETYEVQAFRPDGSLARIVRRDYEPGVPTRAELDARLEEAILQRGSEYRDALLDIIPDVPMVERFPAFGPMLADALGHLWIAEFRRPGEDPSRTVWTVFDREGVVQGFVDTPSDLEVYEIGADYVLGRSKDEVDTEYVQVWGLGGEQSAGSSPPFSGSTAALPVKKPSRNQVIDGQGLTGIEGLSCAFQSRKPARGPSRVARRLQGGPSSSNRTTRTIGRPDSSLSTYAISPPGPNAAGMRTPFAARVPT